MMRNDLQNNSTAWLARLSYAIRIFIARKFLHLSTRLALSAVWIAPEITARKTGS